MRWLFQTPPSIPSPPPSPQRPFCFSHLQRPSPCKLGWEQSWAILFMQVWLLLMLKYASLGPTLKPICSLIKHEEFCSSRWSKTISSRVSVPLMARTLWGWGRRSPFQMNCEKCSLAAVRVSHPIKNAKLWEGFLQAPISLHCSTLVFQVKSTALPTNCNSLTYTMLVAQPVWFWWYCTRKGSCLY